MMKPEELEDHVARVLSLMEHAGRHGQAIDPPASLTVNGDLWRQMLQPEAYRLMRQTPEGLTLFEIPLTHNERLGDRIAALLLHASGAFTIWRMNKDDEWESVTTEAPKKLLFYQPR